MAVDWSLLLAVLTDALVSLAVCSLPHGLWSGKSGSVSNHLAPLPEELGSLWARVWVGVKASGG